MEHRRINSIEQLYITMYKKSTSRKYIEMYRGVLCGCSCYT